MDQNRNVILALVISFAILFGFQLLWPQRPQPQQPKPQPTATETKAPGQAQAPGEPTAAAATSTVRSRSEVLAATPRVRIATARMSGSIDLVGGRLDDLTLNKYHETADPSSPTIELLSPDGSEHPYFVDFGWVGGSDPTVKLPDKEARWTASADQLTAQQPVDLTWDNGQGLRFVRHYAIDDDYMFTVTQSVENNSDRLVTLYPFALLSRTGNPVTSSTYILHEGPIGVLDGTLKEIKYADLKPGKPEEFRSTGGWLGITDKYWLAALIPDQQAQVRARFTSTERDKIEVYQVDYTGGEQVAPAHGKVSTEDRLFAGAKEVHLLNAYESDLHIPLFDHAIDFGWFYWITKPIFLTLDFFYKRIGNFGLAILLLTVIIKLLFFPLANKSYRAMGKMKALQPEIQKLRERFGEDKARLNQEMMALYKRGGANPMAGCLPIVIQIPVFFSLYKVLYVTIEMRHAPFFGWIHDLSAPDPTTFVNLFGLLPFAVPPSMSFLMVGAWPIVMGLTQFLQQKLSPQAMDPVQAKMFLFLPLVFTYMLSQFAAGLVIYWTWNNLLSIAQQWLIMRRSAAAPATA